jgi:tetratricopeptide (TPR) repeat protein
MAKATKAKPQPEKPKTPARPAGDPDIDAFTAGLSALQNKDWAKATELLERVVAETDRPEVRERARQLLAVSRQKAQEAGGGKAAKEPEADPYLLAVYQKNRGDLQAALDLCRKDGRETKDERFAYLAASIHAVEGRIDEAVQALNRAAELNPKNRIHAFHDPDFAELRKNRDYRPLFGLS